MDTRVVLNHIGTVSKALSTFSRSSRDHAGCVKGYYNIITLYSHGYGGCGGISFGDQKFRVPVAKISDMVCSKFK